MKYLTFSLILFSIAFSNFVFAADDALIAKLQTETVDVTSRFTGQSVLVFGALAKPGDVIIKVTSPDEAMAFKNKKSVGPFWLDGGKLTVRGAPGLFYLLSSSPIEQVVSATEQQKYGLQLQNALLNAKTDQPPSEVMKDWQKEFRRLKQKTGYYQNLPTAITLVQHRLFSTNIELPAKIPLGTYQLDIYLAQKGKIINHKVQKLTVRQVKLEHWVSNTVNFSPWLFGVIFTISSMMLGLFLGVILRRQ